MSDTDRTRIIDTLRKLLAHQKSAADGSMARW